MGDKMSSAPSAKRYGGHDDDAHAHAHKKQKKSHHQHKAAAAAADDGDEDAVFDDRFSSANAKKRIRDIVRRLQGGSRPGGRRLPATVQQDLERELAALRGQLAAREAHRQRAHMIKKYHMLRFFERKKAARLEKQLERRLGGEEGKKAKKSEKDDDNVKALRADLHIAHIDRLYTQYFPFLEPYVSLYPPGQRDGGGDDDGDGDGDDAADKSTAAKKESSAARALHAPRPPMWAVIEETLRTGGVAALERLRDRKPGQAAEAGAAVTEEVDGKKKSKKKNKAGANDMAGGRGTSASRRPNAPVDAADAADSDDGGFFEMA